MASFKVSTVNGKSRTTHYTVLRAMELPTKQPSRTGVLCIFLCFALGIANIFHANFVIVFSIICLYVSASLSSVETCN